MTVRNAVLHLLNDQPLVADLFELPSVSDTAVLCTNLRTLDGKRPIYADHTDSIFLIPLFQIRFVEVPPSAADAGGDWRADEADLPISLEAGPEPELEMDEDLLRRVRDA